MNGLRRSRRDIAAQFRTKEFEKVCWSRGGAAGLGRLFIDKRYLPFLGVGIGPDIKFELGQLFVRELFELDPAASGYR